jgi:hypothetical protein
MRLRSDTLPAALALAMSLCEAGQPARSASAAGVAFQWSVEQGLLHGCMAAATQGWIAVGFNPKAGLAGARLVMGRVVNGNAEVEVHLAHPPQHRRLLRPGGGALVSEVAGQQRDGRTQVCFTMPLAAQASADVALIPGAWVDLTLAWSQEPDFAHHSAQRDSVVGLLF